MPDTSSASPESQPHRAMHNFRGDMRAALPLHPLEKALVIIASTQLVFMPWALGSMHAWSQITALGLAALGFIVALIPRHYTSDYAREGEFRLLMWPKLVRFPIFWLGLLLLAYITTQALNPAWGYVTIPNRGYTILPMPHITWLPTSVRAPFEAMNAWRMLIIYAGAWLLACALWTGLTRRNAVQAILTAVVISGAVLGLVAILQRVTGTPHILWSIDRKVPYFVGTFIYKNHAGAYFNLVLAIAAALGVWHYIRASRRMDRTSPAPAFAFAGLIIGIVVLISYSRAATILMLGFTVIGVIAFLVWFLAGAKGQRNTGVTLIVCGIFALFTGMGAYVLQGGKAVDEVDKLIQQIASGENSSQPVHQDSIRGRTLAYRATWDMAQDQIITGWGSGGFRWIFPAFQKNYPGIYKSPDKWARMFFWEHAHNDYLEGLAELGIAGALLVLGLLGTGAANIMRHGGLSRLPTLILCGGLLMTLAQSATDFGFYNPAILCTFTVALVLAGRWAELENRR